MPLDRKLPLNALRAFEATARRGSLSAAALELRVSVGAVSRQVALLEAYLACKLFHRSRHGVMLTARGRQLHPGIEEAFQIIQSSRHQLARDTLEGRLNVSLYTTFANEWFAARLPRFRASFPDIELSLAISVGEADFDSDQVDCAVTAAPAIDNRQHYDLLFDSVLVPVCSPGLLERTGPLELPEALAGQTLLYEVREALFWRRWFEAVGYDAPVRLNNGIRFESASQAYQFARHGTGIALGQTFYLANDLANGTFIAPIPCAISVPHRHHLAFRRSRIEEPLIRTFRDWLLEEASTSLLAAGKLPFTLMTSSTGLPVHDR